VSFGYPMTGDCMRLRMSWREDCTAGALVAATFLLAAPLWYVRVPSMTDYAAHLATFWLIAGGTSSFYHIHWIFAPNIASEMLVPLMARLVGIEIAAKLFLSLALALWVLGAGGVQRALTGRIGVAPLFGALFAYNANFFWGFFNYYFAAGLSLMVFAAWIATGKRPGAARNLAFALAVAITYVCHIFAAASLLVMIAGHEIARGVLQGDLMRRASNVFLVFLPTALAYLFLMPAGNDKTVAFNLRNTMIDRFESLSLRHFDDPAYAFPIVLGVGLLLALVTRRARIVPVMLPGLAFLLLAALLVPEEAMGGWGLHLRLPALVAILLLASTELKTGPSLNGALTVLALGLAGWTSLNLAGDWRLYDSQVTEFRAALAAVPQGTRLFTVLDGDAIGEKSDQAYWHMAEWAIPDRGAMTALMFTTRGQHVIRLKRPLDRFAAATAAQGSPPDIGELGDLAAGETTDDPAIRSDFPYLVHFQCHYDKAVVIHLGGRRARAPDMLALNRQGSFFSVYNVRQDAACEGR
jgi:hypothetical protein